MKGIVRCAHNLRDLHNSSYFSHKRTRIINKYVYTDEIYKPDQSIYMPCLTLKTSDMKVLDSKEYKKYIGESRKEFDIFVWTRASFGRRAWKSV